MGGAVLFERLWCVCLCVFVCFVVFLGGFAVQGVKGKKRAVQHNICEVIVGLV